MRGDDSWDESLIERVLILFDMLKESIKEVERI